MLAGSKNIRGGSASTIQITNDDSNASWLTMTGDTVTANDTLYVNGIDVEVEFTNKQDVLDGTTDLTVQNLTTTGTASIAGDTTMTNLTATGTVDITGALTSASLTTTGDITTANLTASGTGTFTGDVSMDDLTCSNARIDGDISAGDGSINCASDLVVDGDLQVGVSPNVKLFVDLALSQITATGDMLVSGTTTSTGDLIASSDLTVAGDTTTSGTTTSDEINVGSNLLRSDTANSYLGVGCNPWRGFQIYNTVPIPAEATAYSDVGIFMGHDGSNLGINIVDQSTGKEPFVAFQKYLNSNTRDGKIAYDIDNDRMDFYVNKEMTDHSLSLRPLVADFAQQIRGNNGLLIQDGQTLFSGLDDVVVSGGNFRTNAGDIYANTSGNIYTTTGNIGARNTNPTEALDVTGNCLISGDLTVSGSMSFSTITADDIVIGTDLIYSDSGKVGIGKSTGISATLDVDGDIKCVGNCVSATGILQGEQLIATVSSTLASASCTALSNSGNYTSTSGDITLTNGSMGIGTASPGSALHVVGARDTTPNYGVHMGYSDSATGNFGIEISSNVSGDSVIDFTEPNTNVRGRILYDNTNEEFKFKTNNSGYGMVLSSSNDLTITGDLTVDTDTLYVDSANDRVGINTASPVSALHVVGAREQTPTTIGIHLGYGDDSNNYGLDITSTSNNRSDIDFSQVGSNYKGRIRYISDGGASPANTMEFYTSSTKQMGITNNAIDFTDCDLTTTGTITADISPCTGQMIAITCESDQTLTSNSYPFSYGHSNQSSGVFGINLGEGTWKLMSFGFNSHDSPNNYTTDSRLSIEIIKNNTATGDYLFMDWSSSQAHTGQNRYSDVPSSSISSQVDHQPEYVAPASGDSFAFRIKTVTSCHANIVEHRLTTHWMRMDAPRIV